MQSDSTVSPLIPFHLMVDTDFGLVRLINESYRDLSVFEEDKLSLDNDMLIDLLVNREDENPLLSIMKDKSNKNKANELYNEFMDLKYDDILKKSPLTGIGRFAYLLSRMDYMHVTIWCEQDSQYSHLKKIYDGKDFLQRCSIITDNIVDCKPYDPIYFKYSSSINRLKNIVGKNIYIAGYGFNTVSTEDEMIPSEEYSELLVKNFNICAGIVSVYEENKNQEE